MTTFTIIFLIATITCCALCFASGWCFGQAHEIGLEIEEDEFGDEEITDADYPPVW